MAAEGSDVLAVVYAVHDFDAENPDELSFKAGERILVTEKDDQYQDGWWQGRNTKGEQGLFPQTYTQPTPLSPAAAGTPKPAQNGFASVLPVSSNDATAGELPSSRPPSPQREPANASSTEPHGMRATIDEIQNHLDGMYKGNEASHAASLPGTLPPAIEGEQQSRSIASSAPIPIAHTQSNTSVNADDTSSIVSGKSSVLDREVDDDNDRQATGAVMASHAKENLARNIALAQEKEEKKRIAAEREREAERERMRLNAQPVEGLVFSDESDAESAVGDDDDNDSIFPAKKGTEKAFSESPEDYKYQPVSQLTDSAVQQEEAEDTKTRYLGSRDDRMSTSTAVPVPPVSSTNGADPYLVEHPPALEHKDSDAPSSYLPTPVQSPPITTPAIASASAVVLPTPEADRPSAGRSTEDLATTQPLRSPSLTTRAVPEPAVTPPATETSRPTSQAQPEAALQQPVSPHASTAGSSRPGSTLGTAFTPATTLGGYDTSSPRSGTFASRQQSASIAGDPREWTVDQVVEWGQGRGFDSNITSKFREHEISGDVLFDLDINSLKEIDIVAFGPRARIAKAIKELRSTIPGMADTGINTALSPSISGYESGPASAVSPSAASTGFGSTPATPMIYQSRENPIASQYTGQDVRNSPVPEDKPVENAGLGVTQGSPQVAQQSIAEEASETASNAPTESADTGVKASRLQKSSSSTGGRHARQSSGAASTEEGRRTSGRGFSFGTLGRSRKPPPQYTGEGETGSTAGTSTSPSTSMQRSPSNAPSGNRLSARLFAFGNNSSSANTNGHEKGKRSISAPLEAQDPNPGATTPPVNSGGESRTSASTPTPTPRREAPVPPADATGGIRQPTPAEKIGEPDYAGWLRKRSDRYNTWKERYLILKGVHLYILKSPTDDKIKGWVNLSGYKFVSDGRVDRGKYGFKALHETDATHYFSSGDSVVTRNWMKALMKATIGRDYSAPVTSSSNIKTIPLAVAQTMNPPPRPPSPTEAIRMQKASLTTNPNSLSASDAAKLMGASIVPNASSQGMDRALSAGAASAQGGKSPPTSPSRRKPSSFLPPLKSSQRKKPMSEDLTGQTTQSAVAAPPASTFGNFESRPSGMLGADSGRRGSWYGKTVDSPVAREAANAASGSTSENATPRIPVAKTLSPNTGYSELDRRPSAAASAMTSNPSQELLDWINDHLPQGTVKAFEWTDLSSGRLYTRLVEHLGGKKSGIEDSEFDKFRPLQPGRTPDMDYIDVLFRCFDFLLDRGVKTQDVSINDLMTGNVPHLIKLAEIVRTRYEG